MAHLPQYERTGAKAPNAIFLEDPRSCKVYDFAYKPNAPAICYNFNHQRCLNKWRGYELKPLYGTAPDFWLELGEFLFPDESTRGHILDWLAFTVQQPEKKINHGLLLISECQGVGKDSLMEPLRMSMGDHNVEYINASALDADFNEYLIGKKLIVISELDTIGHRRSTYDKLKPMLASPPTVLSVNMKGLRPVPVDNIVNIVAFSNKEVPIVVEGEDRRIFVDRIHRTEDELWHTDKFTNYYQWLQQGGARQVMGWLLKRDVSKFNYGGRAPASEEKKEMSLKGNQMLYTLKQMIDEYEEPFHQDLVFTEDIRDAIKNLGFNKYQGTQMNALKQIGMVRLATRPRIDGRQRKIWACRRTDYWLLREEQSEVLKEGYVKGVVDAGTSQPAKSEDLPF